MVSKNLKIEIRPIPNRQNIRAFSEKLEYFSQAHIISPAVDPVRMKYKTGLSEEEVAELRSMGFPYELSDVFRHGEPHPFWESFLVKVELKNSPIFLYPGKSLLDFVKYKFLLESEFIYKSEEEMNAGFKPRATHFIYNEDEELAVKSTKLAKRNSLIKAVSELSPARKRQLVLIINNELTENKSDDYLNVRLEEIIEDHDKKHLLEQLLDTDKAEIDTTALIRMAVKKNVLRKLKKGYHYFDVNLGLTEEDVRAFLMKDDNQEILLTIKSKIE